MRDGSTSPQAPPLPGGERSDRVSDPGEGVPDFRRDFDPPSPQPSPQRGEGAGRAWPRRLRWSLAAVGLTLLVAVGIAAAWIVSLGRAPIGEGLDFSTLVVDREGRLLRPYATPEGRWRLPATVESVDPRFLKLLFAYEDKRFRTHRGVDPVALARAA